jgi:hypothetical protein
MANFAAVYDACVLYPAQLRNILLHLAITGAFRARWTERIHDEWMRSLEKRHADLDRPKLERIRKHMDGAIPDCLVRGFEGIESTLTLPDPDDRHVLAAAILCHAGAIVTYNLDDFPASVLAPYGIEAQHPDDFITHLFDLNAAAVIEAVRAHRRSLKNPPKTVDELFDMYRAFGLATTVAALEPMKKLI